MNQAIPPLTQIKVDIDTKDVEGIYSNLAFLHLSPSEFILDFARLMPGPPRAKVHSRIILTPQAAKAVMRLLQENVRKYEAEQGEIRLPGSAMQAPIGFQPASDAPSSEPAAS
jgi:hypothetical protein